MGVEEVIWESNLREKFEQIVQACIPNEFQAQARNIIIASCENNARERNSRIVQEQDMVRGLFKATPPIFFSEIERKLKQMNIDIHKYKETTWEGLEETWKSGTQSITWGITTECNLRCPYCSNDSSEKSPDEMEAEGIKLILDKLAKHFEIQQQKASICWIGGEPLLRKDIYEIIHYSHEQGISNALSTNGTLITIEIARKLKESGLDIIFVSLDSHIKQIHDTLRPYSYDKAIAAIEICKRIGLTVVVSATITKLNIDNLEEFKDFCESKLGVLFYFYQFVGVGRGNKLYDRLALTQEQYRKMYELKNKEIIGMIRQGLLEQLPLMSLFDLVPFMESPKDEREKKYLLEAGVGCQACRRMFAINHRGEMLACGRLGYYDFPLGDLKKQSPEEIMSSEIFNDFRNRIKRKGKCAKCKYLPLCGGGCLAETYIQTKDPFEEYPFCWYNPATILDRENV